MDKKNTVRASTIALRSNREIKNAVTPTKSSATNATAAVKMLALHVAEAQIELGCIRKTRHDLISACLLDPGYEPTALRKVKMKYLLRFARGRVLLAPAPDYVIAALGAQLRGRKNLQRP